MLLENFIKFIVKKSYRKKVIMNVIKLIWCFVGFWKKDEKIGFLDYKMKCFSKLGKKIDRFYWLNVKKF